MACSSDRHEPAQDRDAARGRLLLRRALRELEEILRQADALVSRRSCRKSGRCCQLARTGRVPYLMPLERLWIEQGLSAASRGWPAARADGACALLDEGGARCSLYRFRPFGCRTYFCSEASGREPASAALHRLSARLARVSDSVDPGGEPLPITRFFGG